MLSGLKLANCVPPWYSWLEPKPFWESEEAQAYWDVPVHVEHTFDGANRIDTRFVYHTAMRVLTVEMSCTWLDNRAWELTKQYPGYKIVQLNVIIDVFGGGWSKELDVDMRFLKRDRVMFPRGRGRLCYPALWTLLGHSIDSGADKLYVCFSISFLS